MTAGSLIAVATALGVVAAPLLLAVAGWLRMRREAASVSPRPRRLMFVSTLAFALAFNFTFFIQELFLVLPKALTPGLRPTLFHNNHTWSGTHPLEDLFQGTGALATLISGAACWALLARGRGRTEATRLLLLWMTYAGLFMALPQVVVGAVSDASDLGHAMTYFALATGVRTALALTALLAMPWLALRLSRHFLALSPDARPTRDRARFMFHVATLPALLGIALIVPFRVPREWIEVVIVPAAVILAGVPWMQAGAWRATPASGVVPPVPASPRGLVIALAVTLAIFQLVLRRGIPFY